MVRVSNNTDVTDNVFVSGKGIASAMARGEKVTIGDFLDFTKCNTEVSYHIGFDCKTLFIATFNGILDKGDNATLQFKDVTYKLADGTDYTIKNVPYLRVTIPHGTFKATGILQQSVKVVLESNEQIETISKKTEVYYVKEC